jgi:hypothetical protein
MHWQKLIDASELFRTHVPDATKPYDDLMGHWRRAQWELDEGPSEPEIKLLFTFLNQLRTHYPNNPESRIRFKKAYVKVLPLLRLLKGYDLIEAQFHSQLADGNTLSETIRQVFERLATASREHTKRCESTGTSKILHILRPQLFVMWDSAIRSGYAVKQGSEISDYASWFLPRMQREAQEAVDSYVMEKNCGPRTAVQRLEELGGSRPLAKLVDEYNYCKFTLGLRKLWE